MTVPLERGAIGELFWSTSDAVVMLRDGTVIAWNPAAERLFGVPTAVATAGDFSFEALFARGGEQLAALLDNPAGWVRLDSVGPDPVSVEATAWRLAASDVQVVVLRDLTAALRYARGLRALSAFARDVLGEQPALAELVARIVDLAKQLTDASYAGLLLAGAAAEDAWYFAGSASPERSPLQLPRVAGALGRQLSAGEVVRIDDVGGNPGRLGLPADHPPIGSFLGVALTGGGGEQLGQIVVANAPGRRVFTEADERLLVELATHACVGLRWAERADRARVEEQRRRDVANAARHDIASPLSVGRGYLAMIERRYDAMTPEQRAAALAGLRHAFGRLEEFAGRLLTDERLLAEGFVPQWAEVTVAPLVARLAREHTVAAAHRRVRVVGRVEAGCPPVLTADPGMAREVLDNLIGNAVKFSPDGGLVRVTASPDGGGVRFDVTDAGPGIPAAEQALLFERFARTESSRRDRVPGTGLGLSIVRRLVEAHGGSVGVSSRPGEGSTFWVVLPSRRPTEATPRGEGQPGSA